MKKEIKIQKANEIIYTKVSKTPTIFQQRMYNAFLYAAKQKLNNLKKTNVKLYEGLQETSFQELLPVIEIDLKFLFTIINFGKNSKKYFIDQVKALKEIEVEYNILRIEENGQKEIIFNKEQTPSINYDLVEEWGVHSLIMSPRISFTENKMYFYLSPEVLNYIDKMESYTGFNLLIPAFITSSFTIRLYEFLLRSFMSQSELKEKGSIPKETKIVTAFIELDKLKDIVGLNENNINRKNTRFIERVIKPAIKTINKTNVVEFVIDDYELKKEGRVNKYIRFNLSKRSLNSQEFPLYNFEKNKIETFNYEEYKKHLSKISGPLFVNENSNDETLISDELIKLKEEIINGKIPYIVFKRRLQLLSNTAICNKVLNYKNKALILRINKYGQLELFNPENKEIIKIESFKTIEQIRKWLFANPNRLGDFVDVNNLEEELNETFLNKYLVIKQNNKFYVLLINSVKIKGNSIVFEGDEKVYNNPLKVSFNKDVIDTLVPLGYDEVDDYKIKMYRQKNNELDYQELVEFFNKNRKNFYDKFLLNMENENLKLLQKFEETKDDNIYKNLEKQEKLLQLFVEEEFDRYSTDKLEVLQQFKTFIENL